jgi:hypothetical protein
MIVGYRLSFSLQEIPILVPTLLATRSYLRIRTYSSTLDLPNQHVPVRSQSSVVLSKHVVNANCADVHPKDTFDPIEPPLSYPSLDYRPLVLAPKFLVLTVVFLVMCEAGVITLIVLSLEKPQHLHFRDSQHRWIIKYSPAIIGTITSVWFRAIVSTYNRIIPYVTMASVPVPNDERRRPLTFSTICGINLMSATDWKLQDVLRYRYWVALVVDSTFKVSGFLLVPVKAGLLQVTQDNENGGWTVNIPFRLPRFLRFYALLAISVLSILFGLNNVPTGLKWEPASIA